MTLAIKQTLRETLDAKDEAVMSAVLAGCVNVMVLEPQVLFAFWRERRPGLRGQALEGAAGAGDHNIHPESGAEARFQSVASNDLKLLLS